ncbi:hypothetical protein [Cryptosporangium minutisporangium]|uniref:Uncharacterized protein n=1 Tax=Cryptosporangium minutisporangium TaxID=113569 RepID=A0ABP6T6G5_9ACTN
MAQHPAATPVRPADRTFRPPGWSRDATAEDVETAHRILPMHAPTDSTQGSCASALHLINAPAWPCEQYLWAKAVLDAAERREI